MTTLSAPPVRDSSSYDSIELLHSQTGGNESFRNVAEAEPLFLPVSGKTQATVLLCAFFAVFETIGLSQGYGVFQDYYTSPENTLVPAGQSQNRALIAFIGTFGWGLTWSGSIFVNPLMSRAKHPYLISLVGAILMSLGFALASLSSQAWQLLLTQGLLYGIGSSMLYFPAVSVAPEYFDSHRGAAMGVILSAAGIGGLVFPPVITTLLSRFGPRWTLRALCFINLFIAVPIALITPRPRSTRRRPTLVNLSIAKKPTFIFSVIAAFLQAGGNLVPLTYLTSFSTAIGYSAAFGAILLSLSNGTNAVSRICMGFAADKLGRQNTLIFSVIGSAVCVFTLWLGAAAEDNRSLWIAFVVLYGVFAGGYNALLPTTITEVFGVQAYASINGMTYFIRGLGAISGSPIGGTILGDSTNPIDAAQKRKSVSNYKNLIFYDGSLLLASSLCVVAVRYFDAKEKRSWKWRA